MRKWTFLLLLGFQVASFAPMVAASEEFPIDPALQVQVDFWKRIYSEVRGHEAFLHDERDLSVIYKKINFQGLSRRAKRNFIRKEKREIRQTLLSILKKIRKESSPTFSEEEKRIHTIIGDRSSQELQALSRGIRSQQGLRDRYLKGLSRSYRYLDQIRDILKKEGLPDELAFLPHVESSFNYKAYSKVGAAGIWQFMRASARTYRLKTSYLIDQRRDPIASTYAAIRMLRDNYRRLKTWPLAVTAYNHGPVSIERAVRKVGSRNISEIIAKYQGRRFGFASRNFYATFMATVILSKEPEKYFGSFEKEAPISFSSIRLKRSMSLRKVVEISGFSQKTIQEYNLALRPAAFRSRFRLPSGFEIKMPYLEEKELEARRVAMHSYRPEPGIIKTKGEHIVDYGESLYQIAHNYNVDLTDLILVNDISNPSKIYPGLKLQIPTEKNLKKKTEPVVETIASVAKVEVKAPVEPLEEPPVAIQPEEELPPPDGPLNQVTLVRRFLMPWFKVKQPTMVAAAEPAETTVAETSYEFDPKGYRLDVLKASEGVYEITVEPEETIGHYAEWAKVRAHQIRRANSLYRGGSIQVGQKLKIPMNDQRLMSFNLMRIQFHQAIQEDFFNSYKVSGLKSYIVKSGDSIGEIIRKNEIPFWLFRSVQEPSFQVHLSPGQTIKIPVVASLVEPDEQGET